MFNGVAILFAQGGYLLTIIVKRHTLLKFGKLFLLSQFVKLSTLVFVSFSETIQLLSVRPPWMEEVSKIVRNNLVKTTLALYG